MIKNKDVLEDIKTYPDYFFNTIFADPPYNLGTEWIIDPETGKYREKGKAVDFMNKWKWTSYQWEEFFKESFRVMKHGAFLLLYSMDRQIGPIKYYATLAGFETLQSFYYIYGSGFPKATSASKSISKVRGEKREIVGISSKTGNRESGFAEIRNDGDSGVYGKASINYKTKSNLEEGERWENYKYSQAVFKPAVEEILIFRKPCKTGSPLRDILLWEETGDKTISPSVVNIEAGRIGVDRNDPQLRTINRNVRVNDTSGQNWGLTKKYGDTPEVINISGRFPAHLLLAHKTPIPLMLLIDQTSNDVKDLIGEYFYDREYELLLLQQGVRDNNFEYWNGEEVLQYGVQTINEQNFNDSEQSGTSMSEHELSESVHRTQSEIERWERSILFQEMQSGTSDNNEGRTKSPLREEIFFGQEEQCLRRKNKKQMLNTRETSQLEGRGDCSPGRLCGSNDSNSSRERETDGSKNDGENTRICERTPLVDGNESRASIKNKRSGSSRKRNQIGQSNRESFTNDKGKTLEGTSFGGKEDDHAGAGKSRIEKEDRRIGIPITIIPQKWLKYFYYSGYTIGGCRLVGSSKTNGKEGGYSYTDKSYEVEGPVKDCKSDAPSNYGGEEVEEWICEEGCPVRIMNEQSGNCKTGDLDGSKIKSDNKIYGKRPKQLKGLYKGSEGGSSRYFKTFAFEPSDIFYYTSKASKSEKNAGLDGNGKKVNDGRKSEIDNPFQRGESIRLNSHPCCKPLKLNTYIVSMYKLPDECNQRVYQPFSGSGSEYIGLIKAGFKEENIFACEMSEEYIAIAKKRIKYWKSNDLDTKTNKKVEIKENSESTLW